MSYQMRTDSRSRKTGRFVSKVQKELQKAIVQSGLRQQQVAEKLGVDRSLINRRLTGASNLTMRSIADFAWALDHDIRFELVPLKNARGNEANLPPETVRNTLKVSGFENLPPQPPSAGQQGTYVMIAPKKLHSANSGSAQTSVSSATVRLEAAE